MGGHHGVELLNAAHPFGQTPLGQSRALLVLDPDVVMVTRPVVTEEYQRPHLLVLLSGSSRR
jgi:hypothetical protein